MGIMITYNGYNNPVYNAQKMWVRIIHWSTLYTAKYSILSFLRLYLSISRQRRREGERKEEKHQGVVASRTPPTGDLAHNSGMCPDCEPNQ